MANRNGTSSATSLPADQAALLAGLDKSQVKAILEMAAQKAAAEKVAAERRAQAEARLAQLNAGPWIEVSINRNMPVQENKGSLSLLADFVAENNLPLQGGKLFSAISHKLSAMDLKVSLAIPQAMLGELTSIRNQFPSYTGLRIKGKFQLVPVHKKFPKDHELAGSWMFLTPDGKETDKAEGNQPVKTLQLKGDMLEFWGEYASSGPIQALPEGDELDELIEATKRFSAQNRAAWVASQNLQNKPKQLDDSVDMTVITE